MHEIQLQNVSRPWVELYSECLRLYKFSPRGVILIPSPLLHSGWSAGQAMYMEAILQGIMQVRSGIETGKPRKEARREAGWEAGRTGERKTWKEAGRERDREWETRVLVRRWLDRSAIKILIADICSRLIRSRRRFTFRACLHVFSVSCLNPSFIPFLVPFLCHSSRLSQTSYTSVQWQPPVSCQIRCCPSCVPKTSVAWAIMHEHWTTNLQRL